MLQRKIDKLFKEFPNAFGITDAIYVVGYENDHSTDHDRMPCRVLQICRKGNFKLNKYKWHFRCTSIPFFSDIFGHGVNPDPSKLEH